MADAAAGTGAPTQGQVAAENVTNKAQGQPAQGATPAAGTDKGNPTTGAAQEAMRKFKVRVDNQELEVDEAELLKGYSHGKAASKRFQEGNKAKAQAEAFIKMMKDESSLFDTLRKLGHDPRALAEKYLAAQIEDDMMDPKDKEIKTYKQRVEEFEKAEAKRKSDAQAQEHDKLKAKYAKEFEAQFLDALKTSGLPQTKPMVAEMAKYIKRAADIGYQLVPADAAKLVREDEEARIQGVAGDTPAEILAKMLGEKNLQKLREYEAQRLKDPQANLRTPEDQTDQRRQKEKSSRMTPQEWRAFNRGR